MIEFRESNAPIEYKELREHMVNDSPLDFKLYLQRNIKIKPYVSISKKCAYVDIAAMNLSYRLQDMLSDNVSTTAEMCMYIEMEKLFTGLFMYINVNFNTDYQSYVDYDLIMESGLFDYVMKYAEKDYNRFCADVDVAVGLQNMSVIEAMKTYLHVPTEEEINHIVQSINGIDDTKMDKILRINDMNNPTLKSLVDGMHKQTVQDVTSTMQTKEFVAKSKK